MNRDAIKRTRDAIAVSETYSQREYFSKCGTPACIAGHCVAAEGLVRRRGK